MELSLQAEANGKQERSRLHDQWQKKRERARQDAQRAERQDQVVEPENRLVARTLEARWGAALSKQRAVEEGYHRFAAKLPRTLSGADREPIRTLAGNWAALCNTPETTMADRKQIVRCLVGKVVATSDRFSEVVEVTICWQGGFSSQHQIAGPVRCYEQLKDYEKLT